MTIPEIKTRLPILEVLSHYSLKPTPVNGKPNAHSLHCPFSGHPVKPGKRKKKTFQVYSDTNQYHCFQEGCPGPNGAGSPNRAGSNHGDVIDFIEQMEGCSKHQAIEKAKSLILPNTFQDAHSDDPDHYRGTSGDHQLSGGSVDPSGAGVTKGVFSTTETGQLHYLDPMLDITVLGNISLEGLDRLRTTLKILSVQEPWRHALRHSLDLYNDNQVQQLVRKTAERMELGTTWINGALYNLTDHLEAWRLTEIERTMSADKQDKPRPLSDQEIQTAKAFLMEGELMKRTNELLGQSGIVGEEKNRQILFLVYGSRKREKPLHVICLGASGTGKTYLQEKVARLIPDEEKFTFTASTENAFYYLEPYDLRHKVVSIEDMDGVQYLLYPLRELQTKQWISKVVPVKDHKGDMKTRKLEVYGPICLSGTTTQEKLYEDNANRCLLLHLDGSEEQQESIMDYQRALSANKIETTAEQEAIQLLTNVQRVLEPIKVVNPWAEYLRIPGQCFKPLRTNDHYIQFIETVTWYHQCQRHKKYDPDTGEEFIETTLEDIAIANELIKDVLLTKSDELPAEIRRFFEQVKAWLKSIGQKSFYSKALRSHFRMYPMKANRYIRTLEQYGLLKKSGGNKKQGYEYEVADWDDYERLKAGVNILDELLETLRKRSKPGSIKPKNGQKGGES